MPERIRAIEPNFDGRMFDPPSVVNVAVDSFVAAGLAPSVAIDKPRSYVARFDPTSAIAAAGTLTPQHISHAESLLATLPERLRDAAHSTSDAPFVIYGMLLDTDSELRRKQRGLIATHVGNPGLEAVDRLMPEFQLLGAEHKLPLVQVALPALRTLSPPQLATFLQTLDELVHSDERISPFEFALQKLLTRALKLGHSPKVAVVQFHSFNALETEISVVLSALAQASAIGQTEAHAAFMAGAGQLKLIESQLIFNSEPFEFTALDAALDRLASASGPIKQRTLIAAANVVSANGSVSIAETELLRAVAAALDVPLPPLVVQ